MPGTIFLVIFCAETWCVWGRRGSYDLWPGWISEEEEEKTCGELCWAPTNWRVCYCCWIYSLCVCLFTLLLSFFLLMTFSTPTLTIDLWNWRRTSHLRGLMRTYWRWWTLPKVGVAKAIVNLISSRILFFCVCQLLLLVKWSCDLTDNSSVWRPSLVIVADGGKCFSPFHSLPSSCPSTQRPFPSQRNVASPYDPDSFTNKEVADDQWW